MFLLLWWGLSCEAYSSKLEVGTSFSSRADLRTEQQTAFAVKRRKEGRGPLRKLLNPSPLTSSSFLFAGDVDASKQAKNWGRRGTKKEGEKDEEQQQQVPQFAESRRRHWEEKCRRCKRRKRGTFQLHHQTDNQRIFKKSLSNNNWNPQFNRYVYFSLIDGLKK